MEKLDLPEPAMPPATPMEKHKHHHRKQRRKDPSEHHHPSSHAKPATPPAEADEASPGELIMKGLTKGVIAAGVKAAIESVFGKNNIIAEGSGQVIARGFSVSGGRDLTEGVTKMMKSKG